MSNQTTDSLTFTVKTEKRHIAYANFVVEAYDGIGVIRTADPEAGILEVLVSPDFEVEFRKLAEALGKEIPFKIVE
jgi:hypothetical protein